MSHDSPERLLPILPQLRECLYPARPELAKALAAVAVGVCTQHVVEVRKHIPAASSLNDDAVRDDLPEVLAALAQTYEREDGLGALALLGPAHAAARDGQGFTLRETFSEYLLLRRSIDSHVRSHLGRALSEDESEALHAGIEAILSTTLVSFNHQREDRMRLETTALSHYLTSLAHDLRNEINGAMLSLQLIEETGEELRGPATRPDPALATQRVEELLRDVSACRRTMESTITAMTGLLEAERLRNRVVLRPRDVALLVLMQGIARSASRPGTGASQQGKANTMERIEIRCADDLVLWTDPDLLGAVLVNLLGNAVKYAPDSRIEFVAHRRDTGACRIEVCDHGPGIPPDRVDKLFDKFERGGRHDSAGVGLGLFIARRAADLLGAQITVESELGSGTCFKIDLPGLPPSQPGAVSSLGAQGSRTNAPERRS